MANYTNHTNNKPLAPEIIAEINDRFKKGEAKVRIAVALGISHSAVRKYTPSLPWIISEDLRHEARRLLYEGQTRSHIARTLGVNRTWVSNLAPELKKLKPRIPDHIKEELVRRVSSGEAVANVAREVGINAETARSIASARIEPPSQEKIDQIRLQLLSGINAKKIAIDLQVPLLTIQKLGGRKFFVRYSHEERLEMATLYSQGLNLKEVALRTAATPGYVSIAYKKAVKSGLIIPRITIAMEDDKELSRIKWLYPQLQEWRLYGIQWYTVVHGNFGIVCSAMNRFFDYLAKNSLYVRPADFFLRSNAKTIPPFFGKECMESDHGAAMNNAVTDFLDWILLQPEFSDLSDEDEPLTLPIFRNPINRINRSDHKVHRGSESSKKVMPYWMIHDLRRRLAQGTSFSDWTWAQTMSGKVTLSGDKESRDWFEVSEELIDKADPDCVWRLRNRASDGLKPLLEMWSPVRWVAALLKLQTTARMGQIRMLDSGEADTFIYESGKFIVNQGQMATGTARKPRRQGAFREGDSMALCLYFNTNKTADITKLGPNKGVECPWPAFPDHQDNPYYWLEKLRNWQSKYNPVKAPIAWKSVPSSRRLRGKSEAVCSTYPDAVFLFRTPETENMKEYPLASGALYKIWQSIIERYESVLDEQGVRSPDGSKIQLLRNGRSEVTLHGLRVSLITHLILDGGIAPELMMKIVGHARFIMTIYYTKPGLKRIEDALMDAAMQLDKNKDQNLIRDLKSKSAEQIRDHVVFNSKELIDVIPLNPADRNPLGWLPMHDGICLAGGNTGPISGDNRFPGCHNGGPPIDGPRKTFGPVPGGVRNCCRCRWKCAGKHHALGLQATFNNRQYHLYKASEIAIKAERDRDLLMLHKARQEAANQPFTQAMELRAAERIYEAGMQKMQELALDVAAINRMIERIQEMPINTEGLTPLAAQGDLLTLQTILEDTDSELLVLAGICADVEFFPDLDPGTAIFEFAQLLDQAFEREGKPLILARMSEQEKLKAGNAIMRELEICANPTNPTLGRRKIIEIMDRAESLETVLGIDLRSIAKHAEGSIIKQDSLRLVAKHESGINDS